MNARQRLLAALAAGLLTLAGCAQPPRASFDAPVQRWTGRLALQVQSDPPLAYYAGFELRGSAAHGELALNSPLGNTLATLVWTPESARLLSGNGERRYSSIEALALDLTGAPLPVRALFAWLAGAQTTVDGWQADLSRLEEGRLVATRSVPAPVAELRLVVDR